ncbi:MAG: rod shape-determining protein MreC [Puniceicoccales bacterium]|jgi:rod shape-determining protein MreC|nr:rod shape-determining protein MreC [Puniceicoccales bacterium]
MAILKVFFRCLIIFIIILFFLKKSFNPKLFLQSIAVPFLVIGSKVRRGIDEILFHTESRENLIKICKELTSENLTLRSQLQMDQNLKERLGNLEKLLRIGEKISCQKIYARVIKRNSSAWFESIIINKGSIHGVKPNVLVLAKGHIIGKVMETASQFSTIALTSSPKFRLAVQFENFLAPMIFTGNDSGFCENNANKVGFRAFGVVKNIPINARNSLQIGTKIFAASLAHTDFNMPLGSVAELREQADGIFLQVAIDLPEITNSLQEVLIIVQNDL